ncbi:MAG: transposase [Candidatus Sulfotelmatobacter sp.]
MGRRKRHSPEQARELLRQIEEGIANGNTIAESCMDAKISKSMYLRWRKEYRNAGNGHAHRLSELEQENANLKRLVSELCLQKQALRDIISSGGL